MADVMVEVDGSRIWSTSEGSGTPVVLCNGGPGCSDYLAPISAMLSSSCHAIRFENRGCGKSDPAAQYSIETCLADLEAIRNHYRLDRWIVGGHSFGADLALFYALRYPQHTLGFICIAGGRIHNDREWHRVYREKRDQGLEPLIPEASPVNMDVNKQVNQSWKEYVQRPTLLLELSKLEIPGLFVYGTEDIRPGWPIAQVANLIPNARLRWVKGADHYIWLTHARELRECLFDFVKELA